MLLAIKHYLHDKRTANLDELAWHFKLQPEVLRPMLEHWIRKGRLVRCVRDKPCGSPCASCRPTCNEIFEWQDNITI